MRTATVSKGRRVGEVGGRDEGRGKVQAKLSGGEGGNTAAAKAGSLVTQWPPAALAPAPPARRPSL